MRLILAIIFVVGCYGGYILFGKYEEYKLNKIKPNVNLILWERIYYLKKAFNNNEAYYQNNLIDDRTYLKNLKKIDKHVTRLEIKYGIKKRYIKI